MWQSHDFMRGTQQAYTLKIIVLFFASSGVASWQLHLKKKGTN